MEVGQVQLVPRGYFADITQQVGDFGAALIRNVLVHRGVVGRRGMDYTLDFLLQVFCRRGLTTAFQQLGQFTAKGCDFALVILQSAVAAIMKDSQWVDRTVERQLAPQPREDVGAPFMGDPGGRHIIQPDRRNRMASVPQPGVTVTSEYYTPVAITKRTFSTRCTHATCLRHLRCDSVLAAEAVLQQDQFGVGRQAWRQLRDGLLGVVGLAGHQQATDRLRTGGCLARNVISSGFALFHEREPARRLISLQALFIANDQSDRQACPRQARGPQRAEAAGTQYMPRGRHQHFARIEKGM